MSAVALLWRCLAALAHAAPASAPLRRFGRELHDRYFLPTAIWEDLAALFDEFSAAGCELPQETFRAIWDWRFPKMLEHEGVEVRRAHESWPLLCETPVEGGSTSRFVDTSMHRFEVCATEAFAAAHDIHVHGRLLPLATAGGGKARLAGVRYRRSCLYPCLHPGIPVQLPLDLAITKAGATEVVAAYRMHPNATSFVPLPPGDAELGGPVCRPIFDGALTHDLRLS